MCAARLTMSRATRGLTLGLFLLVFAVLAATAQTTPSSIGVLVDQVFEAYATGRVTQGTDVRAGDRARVSAGKIHLTVVPLVEGVKDGLAEAAIQELVEGLTRTGRFQVAMGDQMAVTLLQGGLRRQDILEGKGLGQAA